MVYVSQLWASLADLDEMGPPVEALASKTEQQKIRALRAASAIIASYARSRYAMPLTVSVEETDATGLTSGSVEFSGVPDDATSIAVQIEDPGGTVGVDTITVTWSLFGNVADTFTHTGTLTSGGVLTIGGLTLTFSGTLAGGDIVTAHAGVDWAVRQHVVNVAAYNLMYNRGVDPQSPDGQELKARNDAALAWAKDIGSEEAKLDEQSDATPGKRETRPRGAGQINPWDWLV